MGTNPILNSTSTCSNCGAGMHSSHGELTYKRNDLVVTVQDVPIILCAACGERYVPGPVGVEIGDAVERFLRVFEAEVAKADTVARPRSLVMAASERIGPRFGT